MSPKWSPMRLAIVGLAVAAVAFVLSMFPAWATIGMFVLMASLPILLAAGIWAIVLKVAAPAQAPTPTAPAPPGWYPHPDDSKWLAYWDGTAWSELDQKHPNR